MSTVPAVLNLHQQTAAGSTGPRTLTTRQCQILYWRKRGLSAGLIARRLGLGDDAVAAAVAELERDGLDPPQRPETTRAGQTLALLWSAAVHAHGRRPYIIAPPEAALSYQEAGRRVESLRRRLHQAGLVKGDRIAVHAEPHLQTALLFWAAMGLGLVFVPLDSAWPQATVDTALALCRPRLVLDGPGFDNGLAAGNGAPAPTPTLDETDLAVILFTSGTTGNPKGVELSQGALFRTAGLIAKTYGFRPGDRLLSLGEFHTMSGLRNPLIATVQAGAAFILPDAAQRRTPAGAFELCRDHGATVLSVVPAFLKLACRWGDRLDAAALAAVRAVLCTGADLSAETVARFQALTGRPVFNYYGLTETCGACILVAPKDAAAAGGAIGRPAGVIAQIVDDGGRVLPPGEPGELRLYSENLMSGYHGRPDLTADLIRDGWLYTGDLAIRRPDGNLVLVGRKREIIKDARGDLIHLAEIEHILEADPAVSEAAVCGFHDRHGDERAVAFVLPAAAADTASLRERLLHSTRETLGPRRAPADLVLVADFPRGANGKILKRTLLQEFLPHAGS